MEQIFRTVIVDDEESAIDNLSFELQRYSYVSVEGTARTGSLGLKVIEYSDGASFTCHDTLFFGGIDGFTTITEDTAFHPVRYTPPLYFTELNILGEEVNIHDYMKETNHSFLLKLNYRQNFFTVTFKIVDYITPNKYSYLYQLNNSEWVYRRENNLSFTQLGYGHHTLNIRYQDVTNGTLSPIYILHIYITPPWYMTTYAITCYILIMIGAFIFSLFRQNSKIRFLII